ncbi:uroporphyrinogen-III synthase [Sphingomonas sp. UYAg733]
MTRRLAVLRPEPGNSATAARAKAFGLTVIRLPLFAVGPVAWTAPDPGIHDALILTSANTIRHGGEGLRAVQALPVLAVGERTAAIARSAGFDVMATGIADVTALLALAEAQGIRRALYLGGRDRIPVTSDVIATAITVYASDALPLTPGEIGALDEAVALLHSARAARRLSELVADRSRIRLAALSDAVLDAAGAGWAGGLAATAPDDDALLGVARMLAD